MESIWQHKYSSVFFRISWDEKNERWGSLIRDSYIRYFKTSKKFDFMNVFQSERECLFVVNSFYSAFADRYFIANGNHINTLGETCRVDILPIKDLYENAELFENVNGNLAFRDRSGRIFRIIRSKSKNHYSSILKCRKVAAKYFGVKDQFDEGGILFTLWDDSMRAIASNRCVKDSCREFFRGNINLFFNEFFFQDIYLG